MHDIHDDDKTCWNCRYCGPDCPYNGEPYEDGAPPCDEFAPSQGHLDWLAECESIQADRLAESGMWGQPTEEVRDVA
ncbi:MAG: hypothetical protein LBQ10_01235 [Desulfovibrio sp.]|jgi:Fe-S-cluster-containing dehydrogenase component|nr:hypothetical protein [Desulfovibrio sp.]